jgi:hypothetical protein
MAGDAIQEELRLAIDAAREQLAADIRSPRPENPGEATADRLAREVAESLSSEAKEQAAYLAIRRWLLEGRAIG